MSQPQILPAWYRSSEHYVDIEYEAIFKHSWLFACLTLELEGKAHYGVRLGNTELLLQLDEEGHPRAFLNVCTHRHAKLCEPGQHKGPVRCPYHSWVFNKQGIPTGIPSKQCFPQVVAAPEQYRLAEFACEVVGQFIFVRLSSEGPGLREYLGNQYAFLERASQGMNGMLDEFQEDVAANWKVVIEN